MPTGLPFLSIWPGSATSHPLRTPQGRRERTAGKPSGDEAAARTGAAAPLTGAADVAAEGLARDIHDRLGPPLTALRYALARLDDQLPADAPGTCREALAHAHQALRAASATAREMSGRHRTHCETRQPGLRAALAQWIDTFGVQTGLEATLEWACEADPAPLVAEAMLRIAQEALHNVVQHARRCTARVTVRIEDGCWFLGVEDGAAPMAPPARGARAGYGMDNMRARAAALGGAFRAIAGRAGGMRIEVWLPGPIQPPPGRSLGNT